MTRLCRLVAVLATVLGLSGQALADPRLEESGRLVESLIDRIQTVFEGDPDPATIRAETDAAIDEFFDYDFIARFSAGNAWRTATDSERSAYKEAFREMLLALAESYFNQIRTLDYEPGEITARGEKIAVVSGLVRDSEGGLPDTVVNWRVRTRPGKPPRIFDIEVENISMLITQQQEHTAIINQNGGSFQALIDSIGDRVEAIREGG